MRSKCTSWCKNRVFRNDVGGILIRVVELHVNKVELIRRRIKLKQGGLLMYNVLIVDDEKIERDGLKFLISKYNLDLNVFEAGNGEKAL